MQRQWVQGRYTHSSLRTPLGRHPKSCLEQEEGSKRGFLRFMWFLFWEQVCVIGLQSPRRAPADAFPDSRLSSSSVKPLCCGILCSSSSGLPSPCTRSSWGAREAAALLVAEPLAVLCGLCVWAVPGEQPGQQCVCSLCFSARLASAVIWNPAKPALPFVLLCK